MFVFPLRTDRPLRSTPYVNYGLIALNVLIFLFQQLETTGSLPFRSGLDSWRLEPMDLRLPNFVTYAFLHGGWMHLIGNMVFLYIFGNNVSDKLGQLGYLMFYLAGAVFSGIGYVLLTGPGASGFIPPVVGASGAIAAVTGAFLVLFPNTNITLFYFFILIGAYEVPALLLVPFFFLQDVIFNFFSAFGQSNVAHVAHISGTVFGVSVALTLAGSRLLPRDQFDLWAMISRWNRRRQFKSQVATGWNPYGTLPPKLGQAGSRGGGPPAPPDPKQQQILDLRAQVSEAMAHRNLPGAVQIYQRLRRIDANQVMGRTAQLDLGNQLAEDQNYAEAAEVYELFLLVYTDSEQHAHIELLTGILYGRYLGETGKAIARLEHALPRLTSEREIEMAKGELARLKGAAV